MVAQRRIDLVLDSVKRLLRIGATANLLNLLQKQHPADLAQVFSELQAKDRLAVLVRQLAEDLREVGGVLLLKEVQEVGGRTNTQQPLDRVEDEINSALRHHRDTPSHPKQLNLACVKGLAIPP